MQRNQLLNGGTLTINQNVALLGGSFSCKAGCSGWIFFPKGEVVQVHPVLIGYRKVFPGTIL